jgi:DNA-binding XRE family transcriptional regulator
MNTFIASDEGFKSFLQTIGAGLRKAREANGYRTQTVADALEITEGELDLIEQGKLDWEVNIIASLCDYYDITVKQLTSHSELSDES